MLFREIIGQKKIREQLVSTIRQQRISHAQLFFGPEGSGKLALAIAYAQYLNCENRLEDDSCGTCPSCIKYRKLAHPDLHFIYPVSGTKEFPKPLSVNFLPHWREFLFRNHYYVSLNDWYTEIGIEKKQGLINKDDCNEIVRILGYKAYEAEYKVMIIWMADKLFHAAAPKILKILEEPPDKTLFLLVSENHDQIINTILSRTQLVNIPKLTEPDLFEALKSRYPNPAGELRNIIALSDGNFCESVKLLDQRSGNELDFKQFRRWMRLCFQKEKEITSLQEFVGEIARTSRESQKAFLNHGLRIIHDCVLFENDGENLVKLEDEEREFVKNFSPFIHLSNSILFTEALNEAIYHVERNANPTILFMDLSLKFSRLLKIRAAS